MQESPFFREHFQEAETLGFSIGFSIGFVLGERKSTINAILMLLNHQFQAEAGQALKPRLEAIEHLERLEELLRAVPRAQSLEAFAQNLQES